MPAPRILLSDEAKGDLHSIENYIAENDGEMRASAVVERIWETMQRLAFMPRMGSGRPYLKRGQRAFPAPPWTIYYEKLPEGDGIEIVRVIDGRRDLPPLFGKKNKRR